MKKILLLALTLISGFCCAQTFKVQNLDVLGQLQLNGATGAAGNFLQSNGGSAPMWGAAIIPNTTNPALNYLSSLTGSVSRTYTSKLGDWNSVMDFGAAGNGSMNDGPAILTASTAGPMIVPPGIYVISASITLPNAIQFLPGAQFQIASGQTVTFNGPIISGVQQIFSGSGGVIINAQYTSSGYPEWWGAVTNNSSVDDSAYINSCIAAMTVCRLQAATYYTVGTILQQTGNRAVVGASPGFTGTGGSTVISNNSASNTIYQIGPNTYTGTLQNTNILKNIVLQRTVGPLIGNQSNGLLMQYTVWGIVDNVLSLESGIGFHIKGTGQTRMTRDSASRSLAGTGSGTDQFYGFLIDGSTNIGFAGGNASVYLDQDSAGSAIAWSSSIDYQGLVASGAFGYSDIFIVNFETSNLGYGINLVGNGNTTSTSDFQNEDVRIYNPILDTNGIAGISFTNTSLYGSIQVVGGYVAFGSSGTPVGVNYSSSKGAVTVMGTEILCTSNASGSAVSAIASRGIVQIGNSYIECKAIPMSLNGVTNSRFEDQIRAFSVGATSQPAIYIHNSSSRLVMKMSVEGASNAYSIGYYLGDTTTTFSEFNASGLDQSAIAVCKTSNNGTCVTSVGTFGTNNYATGVMN